MATRHGRTRKTHPSTLYRTLLVVKAKNSLSNHSILYLTLRSRLFLRKTRLFIRTCSKQNLNGMKWNPNRMKHATICNLFSVILKKFFVKTETGRKPVEEVLCLGSNTPQVPSWVTGNSAILGGVGILQKTYLEPRDPLWPTSGLVFASLTFKTGLELLKL